jgi:hypothetical protein
LDDSLLQQISKERAERETTTSAAHRGSKTLGPVSAGM